MAKLARRSNKKQEARQIASDLLKDYDYVLNPRDNTYQLVHKETGDLYSGTLGGLEADKGLIQKKRRTKRLIGEQLSHQRYSPQQPTQSDVPAGRPQQEQIPQQPTEPTSSVTPATTGTSPKITRTPTSVEELNRDMISQQRKFDSMQELNKELGQQNLLLKAQGRAGSMSTIDDAGAEQSSLLRRLGIRDNVYYPGETFEEMNTLNTLYSKEKPSLDKLFSMRDRQGRRYFVYGEEGKQKYIDLDTLELGKDPKEHSIPEGSHLFKAASTSGFHKGTSKQRISDKYRTIPAFSREYENLIQKALLSDDKYLMVDDKIYSIPEIKQAVGQGKGLSDLQKLGMDLPKGVKTTPPAFRRGNLYYYLNEDDLPLYKCGGKLLPKKKQQGGNLQISKLNPDDLDELDRFGYWKNKRAEFAPLTTSPDEQKPFEFESAVPSGAIKLDPTKKSGMKWDSTTKDGSEPQEARGEGKEYIHLGTSTFDADTRSLAEKGLNVVAPLLGVADFLVQRQALNKIGTEKTPRSYDVAPQVNVQAAQDIPHEVLTARKKEIDRMRSQYKGSDPVMELISKHMVQSEKDRAKGALSADRAAFVADERRRVSREQAENQLRASETDAKNRALTRHYEQADLTQKLDLINRKADLTGQALGLVAKGVENRITTKKMADLKAKDIELKGIDQNISLIESQIRSLDPNDPADVNQINKLQKSLQDLVRQRTGVLGEAQSSYQTMGKEAIFGFKSGGKLLPRK
jgi:hypothetical protein